MRLRPLDEVGHDQEVAGIFHALDDAELEFEPLAVSVLGVTFGEPLRGEAAGEALLGLPAQFGGLVDLAVSSDRESAAGSACGSAAGRRSARRSPPWQPIASGKSENNSSISRRVLKRCSAVSWRRSLSATKRPSAMQISASCAS